MGILLLQSPMTLLTELLKKILSVFFAHKETAYFSRLPSETEAAQAASEAHESALQAGPRGAFTAVSAELAPFNRFS